MNISIFGLGYVGAVTAGCLAREGHTIIGVDANPTKVELINQGQTPIIEKEIGDIIEDAVAQGRLRAVADAAEAVQGSSMSLICVGTPSQMNGRLDLRYVRRVCEEVGAALKSKPNFHVAVVRSTMLPGTMRQVVIPTLEAHSDKRAGEGFGVCNNPEFLREGTAVYDFFHPPKTVIGETDARAGDLLCEIYAELEAPLIRTDIETAEMVKYTDNVWHALKICFANEIGNICKGVGIDSHKVMDIFCQDRKLNISPTYLKPGFAFGGSCLPKDVRALNYKAARLDLDLPVLKSILPSNTVQVERGLQMIMEQGHKKVGILGMSFKAGTDDLRESPVVEVIERLLGKGYDVRIYDRNVNLAGLVGANRDYILNTIPHISGLMVQSMQEILGHAKVLVIGNGDQEFKSILDLKQPDQVVVDLVRIGEKPEQERGYHGICW